MWFLTKLWGAYWLYAIAVIVPHLRIRPGQPLAALGYLLLFWLLANCGVTVVYVITRIFRRASRDSMTRP